ncbi:amidase [Variovorax paradoxus]|uniref:amidase n=1 Tax=Variovorax paradoxus TaxID=34073 RepID=UPI001932A381|nr:amidase [Variovorax paradoxus]
MSEAAIPSIAELRRAIATGRRTVDEALDLQREAFGRGAALHHCVVEHAHASQPVARAPLSGIAMAHKDVFHTGLRAAGQGRPSGSQAGAPPAAASAALQRLAAQGASYLGALAMAEFACGATAENPHFVAPLNPLDPAAAVGGSSSGSAVAVAAGLCRASLGTDTAGSVRIPASTCGVVGFKPGPGAIDARGVSPLAPSLDTVGVIARSVSDAAHVFAALQPDEAPLAQCLASPEGIEQALSRHRPWRVASALDQPDLRDDVAQRLDRFESRATSRAVAWRRIALRGLEPLSCLAQVVLHVEAALTHAHSARHALDSLAPITQAIVLPGWAVPAAWYRHAREARAAWRDAFVAAHLAQADVLLLPSLPRGVPDARAVTTTADGFDPRELVALHRYHAFANYLGLPALSFPVGTDARGRPVCIQALAAPGNEAGLLAFGHQFAATASPLLH